MDPYRILLVDKDDSYVSALSQDLRDKGYRVRSLNSGRDALKNALDFHPHIIILDVDIPDMDGIEICTEIREIKFFPNPLIIFLTHISDDYVEILALESGGDDYITKPIKLRKLHSKLNALLRRHPNHQADGQDSRLKLKTISLNKEKFQVRSKHAEIILPKKQFDVLWLLASYPGKVFDRDEIMQEVWQRKNTKEDRSLDVHISLIRKALGKNIIKSIKGIGYKLVDD